jgi:hypothetical protein
MATYTNGGGHVITIGRNDDNGTFSVRNNFGNNRDYGAAIAANLYQDWDLRGVDLSDDNVPEPDTNNQDDGPDNNPNDDRTMTRATIGAKHPAVPMPRLTRLWH